MTLEIVSLTCYNFEFFQILRDFVDLLLSTAIDICRGFAVDVWTLTIGGQRQNCSPLNVLFAGVITLISQGVLPIDNTRFGVAESNGRIC